MGDKKKVSKKEVEGKRR